MNRDYRHVANENNFAIDTIRGDDLSGFPIERARLRSIWYLLVTGIPAIAGYGWAVQTRTVCNSSKVKKYLTHLWFSSTSPFRWSSNS